VLEQLRNTKRIQSLNQLLQNLSYATLFHHFTILLTVLELLHNCYRDSCD